MAEKSPPPATLRPPRFITIPMFLWSGLVILLHYTTEDYRTGFSMVAELLPSPALFKLPMLLQYAKSIGVLGWFLYLGGGIGFFVLRKLRFEFASKAEAIALSLGLGWGMMGLGIFALGLMRLWFPGLIVGGLIVLSLPAAFGVYRFCNTSWQAKKRWSTVEIFLGCFLAGGVCFNVLGGFTPEIFYDALVYHLALPGLYLTHHGIIPTPDNLYSGIPMLLEMLYGIGLVFGSDEIPHLIHAAFGCFSAVLLIGLFERFLKNRKAGLFAAIMFYFITLVANLSWGACVELGWTFFQFAAVYALAVRVNEGPQQQKWTWMAAVFTGFAMGTKYPAWPLLGILGAMFAVFKYRENAVPSRWWREPVLFVGIASAVVFLWPLKNAVFYGNPELLT